MKEEQLRDLFRSQSDCYADADEDNILSMSEDRFVEVVNKMLPNTRTEQKDTEYRRGYRAALEYCRDCPALQTEQGWIDVNERLPEDQNYYLVYSKADDVVKIAQYGQLFMIWQERTGEQVYLVTKWQPLPKP